jgi:hypothetical protein
MPNPEEAIRAQDTVEDSAAPATTQDETTQTPAPGAQAEPDTTGVPEKFRGKSIEEISRSYRELESFAGRLSSEKSHSQRELEDTKQRLTQIETQLQIAFQQRQQPQNQNQEAPDPFKNIDEEFDADPKGTLRKVVDFARRQPQETSQRVAMEARAIAAKNHYERMSRDNQDFKELEPEMQRLATQFGPMVRPDMVNSPEMIDALYRLAKGSNVDRYAKTAASKAVTQSNLDRAEKRRAVSESAGAGAQGNSKPFEDWSLDEMQKFLGVTTK